MKELKCPKCGSAITVDEADYASIINQVKTSEFEAEVCKRINELKAQQAAEQQVKDVKNREEFNQMMLKKEHEIQAKEQELAILKGELAGVEDKKKLEISQALSDKDLEIARLKSAIELQKAEQDKAVMAAKEKMKDDLNKKERELADLRSAKDLEIAELRNQTTLSKSQSELEKNAIREEYETKLKFAQEQVDYYKDMKAKLSTKMIGETLEQHCSNVFNGQMRPMFPNAYFEKDNDASGGTKGDFIFRDSVDGTEYVSIMFEMKNEADETTTKHKNVDFLKKLDEDRRKKGCEYAVLVSMLEPESELYNGGIVDVSHHYEKMYIVRPQFFVPIITLLTQAAKRSIEVKRELAEARNQSIDITNFEEKLSGFQSDFNKKVTLAHSQYETAIKSIDNAIKDLENVKSWLSKSGNNLRLANETIMDVTIRRLTHMNPTMQQMFAEQRKAKKRAEKGAEKSVEKLTDMEQDNE